MKRIPKQAYTAEFKGRAVKRADEIGGILSDGWGHRQTLLINGGRTPAGPVGGPGGGVVPTAGQAWWARAARGLPGR